MLAWIESVYVALFGILLNLCYPVLGIGVVIMPVCIRCIKKSMLAWIECIYVAPFGMLLNLCYPVSGMWIWIEYTYVVESMLPCVTYTFIHVILWHLW